MKLIEKNENLIKIEVEGGDGTYVCTIFTSENGNIAISISGFLEDGEEVDLEYFETFEEMDFFDNVKIAKEKAGSDTLTLDVMDEKKRFSFILYVKEGCEALFIEKINKKMNFIQTLWYVPHNEMLSDLENIEEEILQ